MVFSLHKEKVWVEKDEAKVITHLNTITFVASHSTIVECQTKGCFMGDSAKGRKQLESELNK